MNPIPVTSCSVGVITVPPAGGQIFSFEVVITLNNGQQLQLRVPTLDEFNAIAAVLQIPGGELLFQPLGQILFKKL